MLCQRHGATAAPEEQRYRRSLRRTHRALAESIGAAPGREGSTAARGEPGGSAGRGLAPPRAGMDLPGRGSGLPGWSCRDGPAAGTADGGERLVGWGHQPVPPPDPSAELSPPPAPVTAESRPPRGWIGIFLGSNRPCLGWPDSAPRLRYGTKTPDEFLFFVLEMHIAEGDVHSDPHFPWITSREWETGTRSSSASYPQGYGVLCAPGTG